MNSRNVAQPTPTEHPTETQKTYEKPAIRTVTPKAAKKILLQKDDPSDPEVIRMLQCIEDLLEASE